MNADNNDSLERCVAISGEVNQDNEVIPGLYLGDNFPTAQEYGIWLENNVFGGPLMYWDITTQIVCEYLHNFTLAVYVYTPRPNDIPEVRLDTAHSICRALLLPILNQLDLQAEVYPINRTQVPVVLKVMFYPGGREHTKKDKDFPPLEKKKRKVVGGKKANGRPSKKAGGKNEGGGEGIAHYDIIVNIADLGVR